MNEETPRDLLLYCPNCFEQHVDEAKPDICQDCGHGADYHTGPVTGKAYCRKMGCECETFNAWLNPPHKSHRCNFCNHVWRPADFPTNGVQAITTKGERDGSSRPVAFANGKDFNDAVSYVGHAAAGEWREFKDEHPIELAQYIITAIRADGSLHVTQAYFNGRQFEMTDGTPVTYNTVAWMSLPEPFNSQEASSDE